MPTITIIYILKRKDIELVGYYYSQVPAAVEDKVESCKEIQQDATDQEYPVWDQVSIKAWR